jgi:hypothetical protein
VIVNWTDLIVRATISFMSASGAAPLPRLGEVFFDVRGSSRSMRLSWYADTDVAVFSIWQGGMCTGTFRLPMADLARMVETLQRGPDRGRRAGGPGGGHRARDYGPGDYGPGDYGDGEYQAGDYGGDEYRPADRRAEDRADRYSGNEYPAADYYPERDIPTGTSWRDDRSYQGDDTGQQQFADDDVARYSPDRFVPPYVPTADDAYPADNQPGYPGDRPPARPAVRHSGRHHSD